MNFIKKLIQYFLYFLKVQKIKVKEPIYSLPIDYNTALRSLTRKNNEEISYKTYPVKWYLVYSKIKITKVEVNFENLKYKYIYSSWLSDPNFIERSLYKFSEDDYDFMNDSLKESLFKHENSKLLKEYSYENNKFSATYNSLEEILRKTNNKYIQEYILDQIFKLYPEKLYYLIDLIYTSKYSDYIKWYYWKLLVLLFEFTDYKTLILYFDTIESTYTWDEKSWVIKKKLLEIIQRKNTLEIRQEQLKKWLL